MRDDVADLAHALGPQQLAERGLRAGRRTGRRAGRRPAGSRAPRPAGGCTASSSSWRMTGSTVRSRARAVASTWSQVPPGRAPPPLVGVVSLEPERGERDRTSRRRPSPRRSRSGTRTSVRNTSLNDEPPLICRIGRTSMPGVSIGTRNAVRPTVLRRVGIGPGDEQAPLGELGARAPHLLAVDHPLVAVADGSASERGEVGAGRTARRTAGSRRSRRAGGGR